MEIYIGSLIKQQLKKSGLSKSEFARRINKTSQNVYAIFKRKSIDTSLLQKISLALEHDFFQYYYAGNSLAEPIVEYGTLTEKLETLQTNYKKCEEEKAGMKKEIDYLTEINAFLKEKLRG